MIVESIGRVLSRLLPPVSTYGLVFTLLVLLLVGLLGLYLGPQVTLFARRVRQVDSLPGPKCTSLILGNVPFDVLKSMITSADQKQLIISMAINNTEQH